MFEYQNPKYLSKVAQREEVSRKIFSERKLILARSQKTLSSIKREHKDLKLADFKTIQKEIKKVLEHPIPDKPRQKQKPSSMFAAVSRETTLSQKDTPGVGAYNINYKSIQKHVSIPKIPKIKRKASKQPIDPYCHRKYNEETFSAKSVIKAPSFSKQLPRFTPTPHSSQTSYLNYDIIPKHVHTPNLEKQLPRTSIFEGKGGPEYEPDKEKTLKKISVNFDFSKMQGRINKTPPAESIFSMSPQSFIEGKIGDIKKSLPLFLKLPI